ncbi:response regulator [Desulfobacterales bacterium HSG16]|nr:response regulator [Desulfobacterales bacterium HSG16]
MACILIVDDDESIRRMLTQMLERGGYEVFNAQDGNVALKMCDQTSFDLVITDLIMPEKEGIETIKEIKENFPTMNIIAMSGGGRIRPENYLKIAGSLGAACTLTKPIERKKLLAAVKALVKEDI